MNKFTIRAKNALNDFKTNCNKDENDPNKMRKRNKSVSKTEKKSTKSEKCATTDVQTVSQKEVASFENEANVSECSENRQPLLPPLRIFQCSICKKAFQTAENVWNHLTKQHKDAILNYNMEKLPHEVDTEDHCEKTRHRRHTTFAKKIPEVEVGVKTVSRNFEELHKIISPIQEDIVKYLQEILNRISLYETSEIKSQNENLQQLNSKLKELYVKTKSSEDGIKLLTENHEHLQANVKKELSEQQSAFSKYQASLNKLLNEYMKSHSNEMDSFKQALECDLNAFEKEIRDERVKQNLAWENKMAFIDSKHINNFQNLKNMLETTVEHLSAKREPHDMEAVLERHLQSYIQKISQRAHSPISSTAHPKVVKKSTSRGKQRRERIIPKPKPKTIEQTLEQVKQQFDASFSWDNTYFDVIAEVEAKMEGLKFPTGVQRLTASEYDEKRKLLMQEARHLEKKIKNFKVLRNHLENKVNETARAIAPLKAKAAPLILKPQSSNVEAAPTFSFRSSQPGSRRPIKSALTYSIQIDSPTKLDRHFETKASTLNRESMGFYVDTFNERYKDPNSIANASSLNGQVEQVVKNPIETISVEAFSKVQSNYDSSESDSDHCEQKVVPRRLPEKHVSFDPNQDYKGSEISFRSNSTAGTGGDESGVENETSSGASACSIDFPQKHMKDTKFAKSAHLSSPLSKEDSSDLVLEEDPDSDTISSMDSCHDLDEQLDNEPPILAKPPKDYRHNQ